MMKKIFCTLAIWGAAFLCQAQNNEIIKNYIKTYCGIAVEEMQRTGVPAAIKLAQGIHETMAGQSPLVLKSNNHFGIKCKSGYSGPYVLHDDDRPQERFMKYENAEQSYRDHSDFLKNRSRYAALFELDATDYKGWAYGLKKAGYATNPRYPQLIINFIEKYDLEAYTLMGLGQLAFNEDVNHYFGKKTNTAPLVAETAPAVTYPEAEFNINKARVLYVKAGTSLQEIATRFNIPLSRLFAVNDFMEPLETVKQGTLVFLQLKRTVSEKAYHEVEAGENIYDIAQKEGVRLESILQYNQLTRFDSPAIGSKIKLHDGNSSLVKN
ncbi:glucosaminidase domain-containing protein [Niabella insulamsoli]|uniref:glucosaminidase domain-containing protein n=1 Tax=Niabella insulamsoli TaxID=3144874 RepID=UPI0031FD4CFF